MTATEFLRLAPEGKYDAVIVDSSDPVGMFFIFTIVLPCTFWLADFKLLLN